MQYAILRQNFTQTNRQFFEPLCLHMEFKIV